MLSRLEGSRLRELVVNSPLAACTRLERMFYGLAEFEITDRMDYVICLSQMHGEG